MLDELSIEDEYIMKVDVEGFEENVFKGAKIFLKEYKVKGIIFESSNERDADLKSLLTSYGIK